MGCIFTQHPAFLELLEIKRSYSEMLGRFLKAGSQSIDNRFFSCESL